MFTENIRTDTEDSRWLFFFLLRQDLSVQL